MPGLGCRNTRCRSEMAENSGSRLLDPWRRVVIARRAIYAEHLFIPHRQGFRVLRAKEHAADSSYVFHRQNMIRPSGLWSVVMCIPHCDESGSIAEDRLRTRALRLQHSAKASS